MGYKIDPSAYSDVFAFPKSVVKKHIKLAGAAQLKVLLWLFCRGGICEDTKDISADTGLSKTDIADAMQYWIVNGLVSDTDARSSFDAAKKSKMPENEDLPLFSQKAEFQKADGAPDEDGVFSPAFSKGGKTSKASEAGKQQSGIKTAWQKEKVERPAAKKISRYEIAKRAAESDEIAFLLNEGQKKLGRTLSNAEMTGLVWLHDGEGMSCEVIIMLLEYTSAIGKNNIRYIEATALSWLKEGIDTVAKAENHIIELEKSRQEWRKISSAFGIDRPVPSKNEQTYATRWLREWRFSMKMIKAAYDICADNTGKMSLSYMNKILASWHDGGITKLEDIPEKTGKTTAVKAKNQNKNTKSYDMDEVKQLLASQDEDDT